MAINDITPEEREAYDEYVATTRGGADLGIDNFVTGMRTARGVASEYEPTDDDRLIYYEEGTGSWGDGRNVIILPAPLNTPEDDDETWEYVNKHEGVRVADIVDTLRMVRDRKGDYLAAVDSILAILDPEG